MKLKFRRDQQEIKGLLGGSKGFEFRLTFQAELTPEERELIKRYTVQDYVLTRYVLSDDKQTSHAIDVRKLERGDTIYTKDVIELIALEERIKEACRNLKTLLEVMASFGGEIVVEIE